MPKSDFFFRLRRAFPVGVACGALGCAVCENVGSESSRDAILGTSVASHCFSDNVRFSKAQQFSGGSIF